MAKKETKGKKHHFSHTHAEHHMDGSITVHHQHESDPGKDVKHAVGDLDGLHDSLEEHLGQPNDGEAEINAGAAGAAGTAPSAAMPAGMAGPV